MLCVWIGVLPRGSRPAILDLCSATSRRAGSKRTVRGLPDRRLFLVLFL